LQKDHLYKLLVGFKNNSSISYGFQDLMGLNGPNRKITPRFFRNQPIRNKNGLWWPCLLTDWHKMTNLYRGPAIDASYQVSGLNGPNRKITPMPKIKWVKPKTSDQPDRDDLI
jgi:hypothetical protein